ncbi:MAG: hypothetical protein C7B45_17015 [Sulfobacillus acidophilus]|uniref:Uncharacterized protein n=1 Tax=Sulfobacillus acidophilus TaxID=53633 RepID=A0A2T2WCQ9_9FIRM|nr:MAG: hypothetical protein C7B45_17015 [Sulfobacillus acidophilus]
MMERYRPHSDSLCIAWIGAGGAVALGAANGWPHLLTQGVGLVGTDGALMATGLALMMRQRPAPTAALCWGLMIGKALVLTLAATGTRMPTTVVGAFTLLILLYIAGSLAWERVWILAGGAALAAVLTGFGPTIWAQDLRAAWFVGLAVWLTPGHAKVHVRPVRSSVRPWERR